MRLSLLSGRSQSGWVSFGGYWQKGEVRENSFSLTADDGSAVESQSGILARWPDGSVKWSLHTADSGRMGSSAELLPVPASESGCETKGICIEETEKYWRVDTGRLALEVPRTQNKAASALAENLRLDGKRAAEAVYPVFCLEQSRREDEKTCIRTEREFRGEILESVIEEAGPLQAVFCFRGRHVTGQEAGMPFVIRMYLWKGSEELRFVHTFLYDGKEERDFLKGMGIRAELCMEGKLYDRHIQFAGEEKSFHEAAVILFSNHPRTAPEDLQRQLDGIKYTYDADSPVERAAGQLPVWNRYILTQLNSRSYEIRKQTERACCKLSCRRGSRSPGVMAVQGAAAGLLAGIRDFWQKCPSGLECDGLAEEVCRCTAWFYSPEAEAYDFRHYSVNSYPNTCYEGFQEVGASAYGIAVTSECRLRFTDRVLTEEELDDFALAVQKPAVYTGTPEYYQKRRAFGRWSLPCRRTETERWLEEQLDRMFAFYRKETEERDWYGLFDYGDVMHTYDAVRHVWRYDIGGMAWQNTELVPTYWLWLYFMRTGREDVFSMAEAMSRHCSEVDVYHFGPYKGMGSRHNVRHWGCSCKEVRISMAGHHRFLYYLTGERRLADIFEEVKDADLAMVSNKHSAKRQPDGSVRAGIRSGPDWSSLVSDWMTWYEMTLDETYRRKIETGIADIAAAPFGLASGPDYYYDTATSHLIYCGESETTPNQHLQICMGGPQVWLETADMLGDDTLKELLAELGSFYYLSPEEKAERTGGRIWKRPFSWQMFAAGVAAFSAMRNNDAALAEKTWDILLGEMTARGGAEPVCYAESPGGKKRMELPWLSTNWASQWCLNVIMGLEFIRGSLPEQIEQRRRQ